MSPGPRCACILCALRRHLTPAFRCRVCGGWFPYQDVPGAEAVTTCEGCR